MPVKIFFYYSYADVEFLKKLRRHLTFLKREIDIGHECEITLKTEWGDEVNKVMHLDDPDIILLLISPSFMSSDFCYSKEMQQVIERHERGEVFVIPIILRPVNWQIAPFRKLQALPTDGKPITSDSWLDQDEAFFNVTGGIRQTIEELLASIEFSIEQGDITSFNADVLSLKYAQRFFGTDEIIAHLLNKVGVTIETLRPDIGDYRYVETQNCIQVRYALFIGVQDLLDFNYQHIQEFATRALNILSYRAPETKHLAMTIHGAGFGLDETEAFLAQFRGYIFALQSGHFPQHLEKITIIDRNLERVQRLQKLLTKIS